MKNPKSNQMNFWGFWFEGLKVRRFRVWRFGGLGFRGLEVPVVYVPPNP